jgi:GNAT superfamily N-acetyltransferase
MTDVSVVPANAATWADLQAVFGTRGDAARCWCQWFKLPNADWRDVPMEVRAARLRSQTACGDPGAPATSGLVAYLEGEPVGWCAVEPRRVYPRLLRGEVPWAGRDEDRDDAGVWVVTCFVVRTGFRRRGVSRALAIAAVPFARDRGARALEGYPRIVEPGTKPGAGDLFVGTPGTFAAAGFREVSRPTPRRSVMRVDF